MRRKNNEISWVKLVQLSPTIEYYTTHYSAIIAAYICFSAIIIIYFQYLFSTEEKAEGLIGSAISVILFILLVVR
jgi:hypothetical protein